MRTPYDTGKVKIGLYYEPEPYVETDSDMLLLQSYLIQDPVLLRRQYWIQKAYWALLILIMLTIWLST